MVGHVGHPHGRALLGCCGLPRTEGGAGLRSRHTHCHHCRGRVYRRQAQAGLGRECHYPEHRCLLGCRRRRGYLHPACHLHSAGKVPGNERIVPQHLPQLFARRCAGHPVPHPLPQILRQRHARQVSLPGGHSHHSGAGFWTEGGLAGQAAAHRRTGGRSLRLRRGHLRLVERECHLAHDGLG